MAIKKANFIQNYGFNHLLTTTYIINPVLISNLKK